MENLVSSFAFKFKLRRYIKGERSEWALLRQAGAG
jgi:hypothetical protein